MQEVEALERAGTGGGGRGGGRRGGRGGQRWGVGWGRAREGRRGGGQGGRVGRGSEVGHRNPSDFASADSGVGAEGIFLS